MWGVGEGGGPRGWLVPGCIKTETSRSGKILKGGLTVNFGGIFVSPLLELLSPPNLAHIKYMATSVSAPSFESIG